MIAATPTPVLDRVFRRLSRAADHGKLWLGFAAISAIAGGPAAGERQSLGDACNRPITIPWK